MSIARPGPYPWRLGATSWVVPADLMTNVRLLAGQVDDIQLLFFESAAEAGLKHQPKVDELSRLASAHNLSYTVHLPTDLRLGAPDAARRQAGIAEILRLREILAPLPVQAFDLHLEEEPGLAPAAWLGYVEQSLATLAEKLGDVGELIAIENLGSELNPILPLVRRYGFGLCLDLGHLLRDGYDWPLALAEWLPAARHIHYHGVANGRDHHAVDGSQAAVTHALGEAMVRTDYRGVVTLEVYTEERLAVSLAALNAAWGEFVGAG